MYIRTARENDFAQWLALWLGYQEFYKATIPEHITNTTWKRFMDTNEPMYCAVAELDDRLVGIVHYIHHRSCWTEGDYTYLQDLFVEPGLRAQGVGRALIEHVYAKAKEAGASRVYWLTHESNTNAMVLYDQVANKSGFIQYRKVF